MAFVDLVFLVCASMMMVFAPQEAYAAQNPSTQITSRRILDFGHKFASSTNHEHHEEVPESFYLRGRHLMEPRRSNLVELDDGDHLELQVCQCDTNGPVWYCMNETIPITLFHNIYHVCVMTDKDNVSFESLEKFGILHGSHHDTKFENGRLAVGSYAFAHGFQTNAVVIKGEYFHSVEEDLWPYFKRSVRAWKFPQTKLIGTIVANINEELWHVPFEIEIPVKRFRVLPFLQGHGVLVWTRRLIFVMFVCALALVTLLVVKDTITFVKLVKNLIYYRRETKESSELSSQEDKVESME